VNPYPYLVEGQAVALEAANKQRLVDTVHAICQPEGGQPAIDAEVCPHPTDHLREIRKGVRGTL
jgi:hypothetical protein